MLDYSKMYWVKTHKDTRPKWLAIDWRARGLFRLLLTAVGQDGRLELGDDPMAGVAIAVAAPVDEITPFFKMLVERGSIEVEDNTLIIPNFVEAQRSVMSKAIRAKRFREKSKLQIEKPEPVRVERQAQQQEPKLLDLDQTSPVRIKPRISQDMIERRNAILSKGGSVAKRDGSVTKSDGNKTKRDGCITERDGSVTKSDARPNVTKSDDSITKRDGCITERDGSVTKSDDYITKRDESIIHNTIVTKSDDSITKRDDSSPVGIPSQNVTMSSRRVIGKGRETTKPGRETTKPWPNRKEEIQNGSSGAVEVFSEHQVSNRPLGNFLLKFFSAQIADPEPDPDPTSQKPWLTRSGQIKGDALRPVFDELETAHGLRFSRQQRGFILGQVKRELSQFVRVWDKSEVFDAATKILDAWMAEQEGGQYMALSTTQDVTKKTFGD